MAFQLRNVPFGRSMRYLLVTYGFRLIQAVAILTALIFLLTGNRITFIDRYGNRADIVATILVTVGVIAVLTALNRRVRSAIDRRFFREGYSGQSILTEMDEAIPRLSKTKQLIELAGEKIDDALHPENVTIFLEEVNADYKAAFSSDTSKGGRASTTQRRDLVLRRDEEIINRLRTKLRNHLVITNADLPSQHPSLKLEIVQVDRGSPTLRAVRSVLVVPIASGDRLHGIISLGRRLSGLPYTTEDRRLLLVIANQIARFIESLKMINLVLEEKRTERELETAAEVQRRLFPSGGLEDDALEIYGNSIPALGVGGDYYDYFEMDARRIEIAIADVAGKGIAAALLMSTVQASLRCQLISKERPLTDVVSSMNRVLRRSTGDAGYVTFFLAEFDKETHGLTYVNAGHNPPMLVRRKHAAPAIAGLPLEARNPSQVLPNRMVGVSTGVIANAIGRPVVSLLPTGGPIIGTFLDEPYQQETIPLQSGDLLAVYTDGVTEALNPAGVEFGEEKLRSVLIESLNLPAREAARSILAQVLDWQGRAPQHDDITLIVMKVK